MNSIKEQLIDKLHNADAMFFIEGFECLTSTISFYEADEYFPEDTFVFVNNGYDGMFDQITISEIEASEVTYDENEKRFNITIERENEEKRTIGMQFLVIA